MGLTYVTAEITPITGSETPFSALFLVDTGAIDCVAPSDKLLAAGVDVRGTDAYEMADGSLVEMPYGFAIISFMGSDAPVKVVFAEPGTEPLLGVVALEQTGYGVDPVSKKLFKFTARPLK